MCDVRARRRDWSIKRCLIGVHLVDVSKTSVFGMGYMNKMVRYCNQTRCLPDCSKRFRRSPEQSILAIHAHWSRVQDGFMGVCIRRAKIFTRIPQHTPKGKNCDACRWSSLVNSRHPCRSGRTAHTSPPSRILLTFTGLTGSVLTTSPDMLGPTLEKSNLSDRFCLYTIRTLYT